MNKLNVLFYTHTDQKDLLLYKITYAHMHIMMPGETLSTEMALAVVILDCLQTRKLGYPIIYF